jgi:cellulose biosynthesis protein BcsQ
VSKSAEILEQLERYFPGAVWPAVRYNVRLSEAPGLGQRIFEYAKKSNGAAEKPGGLQWTRQASISSALIPVKGAA